MGYSGFEPLTSSMSSLCDSLTGGGWARQGPHFADVFARVGGYELEPCRVVLLIVL